MSDKPLPPRVQQIVTLLDAEGFKDCSIIRMTPPVYLLHARRTPVDVRVTLRVLETRGVTPQRVERFLREARIAAKLNHPCVVRLYDARKVGQLLVMVFEPFDGRTVLQAIEEVGRMKPQDALRVALPVARALVYAHGLGLVHRGLTPAAILMTSDGSAKLSDFGLAKFLKGMDQRSLTTVGQSLGAPEYAAPEQLSEAKDANELSDVFSFGSTLYHMLTGDAPFVESESAAARPAPRKVRELAPDVPESLAKIVERAMEPEPVKRFWGATELLRSLEHAAREVFKIDDKTPLDVAMRLGHGTAAAAAPSGPDADLGTSGPFKPPAQQKAQPGFAGRFTQVELAELAQMIEHYAKSGLLEIAAENGPQGQIAFREGKAIKARFEAREGRAAILALLSLDEGHFQFSIQKVQDAPEHELTMSPILLEIARMKDEASAAGGASAS